MNKSEASVISLVDIANNQQDISRSNDGVMGLTNEDAAYLCSLSLEELEKLKSQWISQYEYETNVDYETAIDDAYESITKNLSEQEIIKFNSFLESYIEEANGKSLDEKFDALKPYLLDSEHDDLYINTAVCIDKSGLKCYENINATENISESRAVTMSQCNKYFAARLALNSINTAASIITGWFVPGPGWAAATVSVCDLVEALIQYRRCQKSANGK